MNQRNLSMLCDFYELTMGNGYLKEGIGKKIAQRIVLELRDKMSKEQLETASAASPVAAAAVSGGVNHTQEAVAALMVLGYTQAEALHAMEGLDAAGMEADEIIRQCLKKLVKS